jgi:DNA-directed RNA polymerase III subunit RPC8
MFYLCEIEDEMSLPPSQLSGKVMRVLKSVVEAKYVGISIRNIGLVIALYDITKTGSLFIFPGDGHNSVGEVAGLITFRVVIFRPTAGDILIGEPYMSTPTGLRVTVGFYRYIDVPSEALTKPSLFDPNASLWGWIYRGDSNDLVYPYALNQEAIFQVSSYLYTDVLSRQLSISHDEFSSVIFSHSNSDGLGMLKWWL